MDIPLISLIKCIKIGYTHWFDNQHIWFDCKPCEEMPLVGTGSLLHRPFRSSDLHTMICLS